MSPLWMKQKNNNRKGKPSSSTDKQVVCHAHDTAKFYCKMSNKNSPKKTKAIEEISLLTFLFQKMNAGMTVEAAFVLPLFLFFFLNLSSSMEMLRLHGNLTMALWNTGNKISIYGCALKQEKLEKDEQNTLLQEFADIGLSYTYVRKSIENFLDEEYLDESPIANGAKGLIFVGSDYFGQSDLCEMVVTYRMKAPYPLAAFSTFFMENHYYGRFWTGYEIPGTSEEGEIKYFYVTENGTVYHTTSECTHLKLTKEEVELSSIPARRNEQGGKYTLCDKCKRQSLSKTVWISGQGDHYHYSENCPGLKRTVYRVTEKEIQLLKPCSRCGNQ